MTLSFMEHGFDGEPEKECLESNAVSTPVSISLREFPVRLTYLGSQTAQM